jgi:hypothetical protein
MRILPQIHEALADESYDPRVLRSGGTTLRMYGREVLVPSADKGAALEYVHHTQRGKRPPGCWFFQLVDEEM